MKPFEEYTRDEFLAFVQRIYDSPETMNDEQQTALIVEFNDLCAHPSGSDLFYWPGEVEGDYRHNDDPSPEDVTAEVERYRRDHGLPLFADSPTTIHESDHQ